MIEIDIPGYKILRLEHIVFDYNGTLAVGGELIEGVRERLLELADKLVIHVVTADTFGLAAAQVDGIPCRLNVLPKEDQAFGKLDVIEELGAQRCVAVGNGRNDVLMLHAADLGIAVIEGEGTAVAAFAAADVICRSIEDALDLLENPLRLVATLRR